MMEFVDFIVDEELQSLQYTDQVTNVYNQTMKKVFEKYNVELVEIPSKELDNGQIISATEVRMLPLKENWAEIA